MTLEEAIAILFELRDENIRLRAKIAELEARLKSDSSTSSKPPSSDGLGKPPSKDRSLRERSGRKPGGQPGHTGSTLLQSSKPTDTTTHMACTCGHCGKSLEGGRVVGSESRQVFDIPAPPPIIIHEHVGS